MNKNLKKVISAVAALAMTSSAVAALAVDFPDVEATASYNQAVTELSALNVISGYEDGTFRPDELVTRAQMAKMIVDALAETAQAEASKSNSQFTDVSADHWAKGYINQGVADKFIAGYSDTEFGPDDNVTYVQAQKMLISAIGYETYAQGSGGWPNGYKQWAASQGITDGITGITDDTQLTRAQVAQLIDNAMGAPLCVIDTYETLYNGQRVPKLKVKDGEGKDYQSLFTKMHDTYKVYGRVDATSKSGTGLDNDEVSFNVEKADNFDDEYIKATDEPTNVTAYIGDSKADEYLTVYAQALIQKNDDDEWTILSIVPAAANKSVTLLSEDLDESKSDVDTDKVLYFFPTGQTRGAVKYKLANDVTYYVNGIKQDGSFDNAALEQYIASNDTNTVVLQKTTNNGSTSTGANYDTIMITSYTTAVVEQVNDRQTYTQINFKESANNKSSMRVEKDDDSKKYTFTLNGEAIEPTELEENDVLSISFDEADFADSDFYDVIVSRDVQTELKCTSQVNKDNEVTLGGTKYKVVSNMSGLDFETSTSYDVYLDAFGRVAYADENSVSKKIGILKNVYKKANGDWMAEIITKDGQETECKIDDANGAKYEALLADDANKSDRYPKQVVEYKISSANKLTIVDDAVLDFDGGKGEEEYKFNSDKLGSIRISDSTVILDLSDVDSKDTFKVISAEDLKDGVVYTAYGYDESRSDNTSRFVIITDGLGGVNSTTQLSVFLESGSDVEEDGDEVTTITVVNNGEQQTLSIDEDYTDFDVDDYEEGDLIVYAMNAGYVTEAYKIFAKTGAMNTAADYEDFRDGALADMAGMLDEGVADLCKDELTDNDEDVNVQFGILVKNGKVTSLATEVKSDENGMYIELDNTLDLTMNDTKVYTYNFDNGTKYFGRIVLDDGVMTTPDVTAAYENGDKKSNKYYLDTEDTVSDSIVFAVVRTFDEDEAQEIYQIVAE